MLALQDRVWMRVSIKQNKIWPKALRVEGWIEGGITYVLVPS